MEKTEICTLTNNFHKLMQQRNPGPFTWGGFVLTVIGIVLFWFAWRYWSQKS